MLIREPEWSRVAARAVRPLLGQRQSRTQPDREKHPRASGAPPEDHNPRILGLWPAQNPMQISPQIIAGQCPARAPPYLTHAGDLI